jgi:hypothetical protein
MRLGMISSLRTTHHTDTTHRHEHTAQTDARCSFHVVRGRTHSMSSLGRAFGQAWGKQATQASSTPRPRWRQDPLESQVQPELPDPRLPSLPSRPGSVPAPSCRRVGADGGCFAPGRPLHQSRLLRICRAYVSRTWPPHWPRLQEPAGPTSRPEPAALAARHSGPVRYWRRTLAALAAHSVCLRLARDSES